MARKSKAQIEEEQRMHSLTLYVVFSILVLIIYTVVEQVLSSTTQVSHDTLTTCIFATFGGEILACAVIKVFKLKVQGDGEDE